MSLNSLTDVCLKCIIYVCIFHLTTKYVKYLIVTAYKIVYPTISMYCSELNMHFNTLLCMSMITVKCSRRRKVNYACNSP